MSEREPPQDPRSWREFVVTLPEQDHRRLLIALGIALQETRLASEVATQNHGVAQARQRVATALAHLTDAVQLQPPPEVG
jgi:hypothetical protein